MKKSYLAIKFHADHRNKDKIEQLSAIIEKCGYESICIARDIEKWGQKSFSPHELMATTCAIIDSCDVVIIELSEKGVGLGIEAGYAFAKGIPVIAIAHKSEISTTLIGISAQHYVYENESDLNIFMHSALRRYSTDFYQREK